VFYDSSSSKRQAREQAIGVRWDNIFVQGKSRVCRLDASMRNITVNLWRLMTLSVDIRRRKLDWSAPQPRCLHPARSSLGDLPYPLVNSSFPLSFHLSIFGMQPTADRPSLWFALSVVTGLPVLLWAYKVRNLNCPYQRSSVCLILSKSAMMYIFQRKIIYMGAQTVILLT
jgi:hypothetical protein